MGFLLFLVSIILRVIIVTSGILYGLYVSFKNQHIGNAFKKADKKFLIIATSIDKYGNAVCCELFNDILITKDSKYKFGKINQTISAIIGYNLKEGTLTKTGLQVNKILDKTFGKGHTTKAVELDL